MSSVKETMGEQPIFTCKAHVFHIDPKTKRSWMPASTSAVSVSFFYDSSRCLYRIISVEGQKAVINSTVTPNMVFTKTSQKFGQWSDVRANTVYGLGFSSELELQKFIAKFNEVRLSAISKLAENGGTAPVTPITSANASPINARTVPTAETAENLLEPPGNASIPNQSNSSNKQQEAADESVAYAVVVKNHSVANAMPQGGDSPSHQVAGKGEKVNDSGISSAGTGGSSNSTTSSSNSGGCVVNTSTTGSNSNVEAQLKYENDKLKLALAQSSANAKKWEIELATLKNNNARLTSALQESTANVDEWKRQLASLKEENARMKAKYQSDVIEKNKGEIGELAEELRKEIQSLRLHSEQLEMELQTKNLEIKEKNEELKRVASGNMVIESFQKENEELQSTIKLAQEELDIEISAHESRRKIISTLNQQFATRLHELATIHAEIATALGN